MSNVMPPVRGKLTANAPLAPLVWFKSGGTAEWLFEPDGLDDLSEFMSALNPAVPVWPLGLGSNLIVRDGGVPGVTIRLGKSFSGVDVEGNWLLCWGGTPGILVASTARDNGVTGLEFLRGIPGTIGGAAKMNAGAYGRDLSDVLGDATIVMRSGQVRTVDVDAFCSWSACRVKIRSKARSRTGLTL